MAAPLTGDDDRLLVGLKEPFAAGLFDRFYINMHGRDNDVLLLMGAGVYPAAGVVDAWVIVAADGIQRNARFSTELAVNDRGEGVGPMTWEVVETARRWRFDISENLAGIELHAEFEGRLPVFPYRRLEFTSTESRTSFEHAVQSGHWNGELIFDGRHIDIDGWWGQRDRSRGIRGMHAGQGFHLWMQPQFEDWHISLMYDESRDGTPALCDGAVFAPGGQVDPIVAVEHRLTIDEELELRDLCLGLTTASGRIVDLSGACPTTGGPYLQGGGYDGRHGKWQGRDHRSAEWWSLSDGPTPRTLATPYAHRLTKFSCESDTGWGITEFSRTRKPEYVYRATFDR